MQRGQLPRRRTPPGCSSSPSSAWARKLMPAENDGAGDPHIRVTHCMQEEEERRERREGNTRGNCAKSLFLLGCQANDRISGEIALAAASQMSFFAPFSSAYSSHPIERKKGKKVSASLPPSASAPSSLPVARRRIRGLPRPWRPPSFCVFPLSSSSSSSSALTAIIRAESIFHLGVARVGLGRCL